MLLCRKALHTPDLVQALYKIHSSFGNGCVVGKTHSHWIVISRTTSNQDNNKIYFLVAVIIFFTERCNAINGEIAFFRCITHGARRHPLFPKRTLNVTQFVESKLYSSIANLCLLHQNSSAFGVWRGKLELCCSKFSLVEPKTCVASIVLSYHSVFF